MRKKNKVLWSLWGIIIVGLLVMLIGALIFNLMWRFAEERKWYERLVTRVELERISLSEDLNQWFDKYGQEYGVNRSLLRRIAYCESSYKPWALSSNRLYGGLFQFVTPTWEANRKAMGLDSHPDLRFNPEEAIRTAAFKIGREGGNVGAWPVCGLR